MSLQRAYNLITIAALLACSCGDTWINQTASLGSSVAGRRGSFGVAVINKTAFNAVFTFGTYDQLNELTPAFEQFGIGDDDRELAGNTESAIIGLDCGRVLSLGSTGLIDRINAAQLTADQTALTPGVQFFEQPTTQEGEEPAELQLRGTAQGVEFLIGVDFPCNSLVVFTLHDDPNAQQRFSVTMQVVPSETDR